MTIEQILFLTLTIAIIVLSVALVIFFIRVNKTLKSVQNQIDDLGNDPKNLVSNLNQLSADLNHKMKYFDPLFRSIGNVGEGLEFSSSTFKEKHFYKNLKEKIDLEEKPNEDKLNDIFDMVLSGVNLWRKLRHK